MEVIRHFKCQKGCGSITPFDLAAVSRRNSNFVTCSNCGKKWMATIMPSCCRVDVRFVWEENGKILVTIQSFGKV